MKTVRQLKADVTLSGTVKRCPEREPGRCSGVHDVVKTLVVAY